ncbi:MAG: NAD-dependent succinate-semialdehyde dehydrogenase [Robiginitomaculum sp.]|nr:NAD-dependent succinate-semialdehyde dehydrogenase [Robiginitomaculum sp.]
MMKSINPATGETIKEYTALDAGGIEAALVRADTAYTKWRKTELAVRVQLVHALADTLEQTTDASALLMSTEMGKTITAGRAEVEKCVKYCRYTADMAHFYLADEIVETEYKKSFTRPLPLGTILLVMPWNFPFWQVIRVAVAAILAGNTCLLKHASNVPGCALALEDIFTRAGFPKGVFQTLLIGSSKVEAILADDRIMGASVTGSERAGSAVASTCGKYIKPCVLELGGADPFIVMPSADLAAAIDHAITGRMRNNGQSCIAAKRLIIHADIYNEFKAGFIAKVNAIKLGDPLDDSTDMGPLSSRPALTEVAAQMATAKNQGATITYGTQDLPDQGYYMRPAIIEDVTKNMDIYGQEIFAPAAMLFKVKDLDKAIVLANDSQFGLGSVLFSNNENEHEQAISELEAGSTFINRFCSSDIRLPFGGIKRSGYGREMAKEGLRAFTNLKTVIIAN